MARMPRLDPSVTPGRVLQGQSQDQLAQLGCRGPAAGAAGLGPVSPHQVTMPSQHRGGRDDPTQASVPAQFDTAYQRAFVTAREDMNLTELFRCLKYWR